MLVLLAGLRGRRSEDEPGYPLVAALAGASFAMSMVPLLIVYPASYLISDPAYLVVALVVIFAVWALDGSLRCSARTAGHRNWRPHRFPERAGSAFEAPRCKGRLRIGRPPPSRSNSGAWPMLKLRLVQAYDQSVVRRTLLFGAFLAPAFFATSAMFYGAARLLVPADFGILYLAHAIQNIVCAGSVILNIFLTRHYTLLNLSGGLGATAASARAVERMALYLGPVGALALMAAMAIGGRQIGAHSWILAFLVPLDIFGSYLCDLERAAAERTATFRSACSTCCSRRYARRSAWPALSSSARSGPPSSVGSRPRFALSRIPALVLARHSRHGNVRQTRRRSPGYCR